MVARFLSEEIQVKKTKRLKLDRDVVRTLDDGELSEASGGVVPSEPGTKCGPACWPDPPRAVMVAVVLMAMAACSGETSATATKTSALGNENCYIDPDTQQCVCAGSPIVIDMDGDGFALTNVAGGVLFEIVAGRLELWSWTATGSDDAFLALDVNGNGRIDNGWELFGDYTVQATGTERNGFTALALYDAADQGGNGDGAITNVDAVFSRLRLWRDISHDGISQAAELIDLSRAGVSQIGLTYEESSTIDGHGNQFRYSAQIVAESPVASTVYDVFFLTNRTPSPAQDSEAGSGSGTTNAFMTVCKAKCLTSLINNTIMGCDNPYSTVQPSYGEGTVGWIIFETPGDYESYRAAMDLCVARAHIPDETNGLPCMLTPGTSPYVENCKQVPIPPPPDTGC